MNALNRTLKTVIVNLVLVSVGLFSLELITRIRVQSRVSIFHPRSSLLSVLNSIQNKSGAWDYLDQQNSQRYPHPYSMFKGMPNVLDHNDLGYKILDPIEKKTINIAFFGGSTGYNGKPPLVNLLTLKLNNELGYKKYSPINFSVVSSNHNQHIHSLLEDYDKYPIDLVVFYGGYNETLQTAFYDPRPGYPYNFDMRNQLSPELMLLRKHFALYGVFNRIFPSELHKKVWTKKWSREIVDNYSITINKARRLSKTLTTGRCEKSFLFIYQPFQMDKENGVPPSFIKRVHVPLSKLANQSKDGIDLSRELKDSEMYIDIAHVSQEGREVLSDAILASDVFKETISSCSL